MGVGVGLGVGIAAASYFYNKSSNLNPNRFRKSFRLDEMETATSSTHQRASRSSAYLDENKASLLSQFQTTTGVEDVEKAVRYLEDNNWKLESAVSNYLDNPVASLPRNPNANSYESWGTYFWNMGYNFVSSMLPSQGETDPATISSRFLLDFETSYGTTHPTFQQGSFQQACNKSKTEFKFLIVYIHSSLHQNTNEFCRETLCTELISDFVNQNFLCWAGSVNTAEPYKASLILGASTYPFIAVLCNNNSVGGMTICDRIEGLIQPEALMVRLTAVLEQYGGILLQARLDFEERDQSRRIREEQDDAYKQSLLEDEEKQRRLEEEERRKREEIENSEREEQQRLRKLDERQRQKELLKKSLPVEPDASTSSGSSGSDNDVANLVIRLLDGSRLQRRFRKSETLQIVYNYVDSSNIDINEGTYDLVSNFPRKVFSDKSLTLDQAGLFPHASLFMQEK